MKDTYITTEQAAEILGCSSRSVRNMILRGTIKAIMEKVDPTVKKGVYKILLSEIKEIQKQTAVPA